MAILVTMEAKIGNHEGMINIVYPYSVISPIAKDLYPSYIHDKKNKYLSLLTGKEGTDNLTWKDIPLKLTAEVFRRDYSIREIINLKEETILLPLCQISPNHCFLRFGDRRVWKCEILKEQKRIKKQIKILETTEKSFEMEGIKMVFDNGNKIVADTLAAVKVTVTVELGATEMPIKQLVGIDEGTIIELDACAGEPADIKANGILIARGEVVVIEENFGIRVCELLTKFDSNDKAALGIQSPVLGKNENESAESGS
jgi:flagellar motor switch protein FliN